MAELVPALACFLVMGALCAALESLWPEDRLQPRWRADSWTDVSYFLLRVALSIVLFVLMGCLAGKVSTQGRALVASQPLWFQVGAVLVLTDLLSYWVHRLMHRGGILWRVHAVHHSAERMDWLVGARVHPAEHLLQKAVAAIVLYLVGFPLAVFATLVPFIAAYNLLLHANVSWTFGPFKYLIASPAFHRWHHSIHDEECDKNFGQLFVCWDFLFGSLLLPEASTPRRYGLRDGSMPAGMWRQLLFPFRGSPVADVRTTQSDPP
jgi:sterol desaturase/sphingolipid hydroxylase (fatty acid hydroxylase superfamily)